MGILDIFRRKPEAEPVAANAVLEEPIGENQVNEATRILNEYKKGKANLEDRVAADEEWYRLRHWSKMESKDPSKIQPTSGWLFNAIANKHAAAMDNFPVPNILPREEGDQQEAKTLSSIIPVILDQAGFERTYSDVQDSKLKSGTGVYGVTWSPEKLDGKGDVAIEKIDILNLFWEPGVPDIQMSPHFFFVTLVDNDLLKARYPQLSDKLSSPTLTIKDYAHDDAIDTTNKSAVVDWYYKRDAGNGKTVLHYCRYVNSTVLYATENDPNLKERGLYDHGKYPFVFDVLFNVAGSPAGFGYIDIGKSAQEYIDRGNQAILENTLACARPRYFERIDGGINEEEFVDFTKTVVHVDGNLGEDSIRQIAASPLPSIYVDVIQGKIEELKETTGNRDVNTGGTTAGATAASAIAAMQEAGAKLDRDSNKGAYRAYREVVLLVIELIRQFYTEERKFRILGADGQTEFVGYSNEGIQPEYQGQAFGIDLGYRVPLFDVEVTAEKASPYNRMARNELVLQLYGANFFAPKNATQAALALSMMDFDGKEEMLTKIQQNGTLLQMYQQMEQQMMMLAAMADRAKGGNEITANLMLQLQQQDAQLGLTAPAQPQGVPEMPELDGGESPVTAKARERVAESTAVR